MNQTAPAQESCKLPSLHITHIMHNWKSHEQRIGPTLNNKQVPLSTKYKLRIRNLCAQHSGTIKEMSHRHMCVCVCVCVNAIRTILQFTRVTHGRTAPTQKDNDDEDVVGDDGDACALCCTKSDLEKMYMCRYVFPRTIWRVPHLSSNQKLLQMQEYTHELMQPGTSSPPYVPYDAPMPHACEQVLNMCPIETMNITCPIETMNIIVLLLLLGQSLSTDKWPCHMEAPLVCTIHGVNLIIHIMPLAPFGPFAIPNENIRRCPGAQWTNPNNVPKTINGNRYFIHTTSIFWIEDEITKDASYGSDGHAINVMCDKIRKVWDMAPLRQSFRPSNFSDNTIQVRTNTMHTCPPSVLRAPCCAAHMATRRNATQKRY